MKTRKQIDKEIIAKWLTIAQEHPYPESLISFAIRIYKEEDLDITQYCRGL